MRAVICGAGVAGLTLAAQLGRAGWDVVLLDPGTGPVNGDYLIDLGSEGLAAADQMGVLPAVREGAQPVSRICWVYEAGSVVANVNVDTDESSKGIGTLKMLRGDLECALLQNLPRSVDLRFGFDVA